MPVLKCKMCGGDIVFTGETVVGRCDCCGSATTFPTISEEQLTNLFNRANSLRLRGEFDRAATTYERILSEDETSAEAHWGVVLCHYGIEYVEDPDSHRRIPTCRLTQRDSILQHEDYLAALQYADPVAKEFYEKEAAYINAVQKHIHMLSRSEDPYDIFICYKESTDTGERTKASVLAQDLYVQLSKAGYRVFFSRVTLEDKLGQQYEPYIFAALNSAKVMLVVGTEPDQFTAPWVRNEWSRFLPLLGEGGDRRLIPCYRDMDPYDLPDELSPFQCQDMGKVGFEQDLLRGLEKLLRKEPTVHAINSGPADVSALIRRGQLFLEDYHWAEASSYFDRALDLAPECAEAYIGKLCAELWSPNLEQIVPTCRAQLDCKTQAVETTTVFVPLNRRDSYIKALRFADSGLRDKLEQCFQEVAELIDVYRAEKKQVLGEAIDAVQTQITQCAQELDGTTRRLKSGEERRQQLQQDRKRFHLHLNALSFRDEPSYMVPTIVAFLVMLFGTGMLAMIGLGGLSFLIAIVLAVICRQAMVSSINQKFDELNRQIASQSEENSKTEQNVRNLKTRQEELLNRVEILQQQYNKL